MKQPRKNNIILLLFFASAIVVMALSIYVSQVMNASARMLEESTVGQLKATSEAVALMVTAEELDVFQTAEDMQTPAYQALKRRLDAFAEVHGLMYAYFMRLEPEADHMRYIIDNVMAESLEEGEIPDGLDSEPFPREDTFDSALLGNPSVAPLGSYSEGWDGLLSAFAPVYYADGTLSGTVAGVDVQDVYLRKARDNMRLLSAALLLSLALVLGTCLFCMLMYQRKAKQSEIASEAKGSFLSRMSHEMRTPLNAISGLSRMAIESGDPAQIQDYLEKIGVSSLHLRQVIDDVLDISKIESGKMTLEFIPVNFREQMEAIDSIIRPQAAAKGQRFDIKIGPGVPEFVYYDPTHVRQIVINLLSNAIKFTGEGGEISLSVERAEVREGRCNLRWRVRDTGIGMDEEAKRRLFVPFEQADVSTTRKYGGTGLGLAISKQLVEMMNGQISVKSTPGKGSEFTFNLWLKIAGAEALRQSAKARGEKPDLTGKTILMVEDAELNQLIAANMLEGYGARVEIANNGREGVDMFLKHPQRYDLILMDIQMPVMDGYEATRTIRASGAPRAAEVPIIAITANVFQDDVDRAFEAGMNGHVRKPLETQQVEETLQNVLA